MADTTKPSTGSSSSKAADSKAADAKAADGTGGDNIGPDGAPKPVEGLPFTTEDAAAYDGRARGDDLEMSDRDAGSSHLAAQNQVPQEGALVTDPPQPVPPKDANIGVQDISDDKSRTVEYPEARKSGHAVPVEYPRDAQR
jgi:hypothetical protein